MGRAKEIEVRVIPAKIGNAFVKRHHYSRKVVPNSQLHFGAFLDGKLHGVMSYGPPADKSKVIGLVDGTEWYGMLELNRMAFDEYLPRNSESYCISKSIKLIKKNAPQVKWILSFADGCQCGDGTIYRASNDGYQLRCIYFIDKSYRQRLTVPEIPFSKIDEIGAGMYKGQKVLWPNGTAESDIISGRNRPTCGASSVAERPETIGETGVRFTPRRSITLGKRAVV